MASGKPGTAPTDPPIDPLGRAGDANNDAARIESDRKRAALTAATMVLTTHIAQLTGTVDRAILVLAQMDQIRGQAVSSRPIPASPTRPASAPASAPVVKPTPPPASPRTDRPAVPPSAPPRTDRPAVPAPPAPPSRGDPLMAAVVQMAKLIPVAKSVPVAPFAGPRPGPALAERAPTLARAVLPTAERATGAAAQRAALISALGDLTKQIVGLNDTIARGRSGAGAGAAPKPSGLEKPAGGKGGGGMMAGLAGGAAGFLAGMAGSFVSQITAGLKPLDLLSSALQSTNSGLAAFQQMTKLVAAVLANAFMPIFIAGAGVMYALAQLIANELNPALKDFYSVALTESMDVLSGWKDAIAAVSDIFSSLGKVLERLGVSTDSLSGRFLEILKWLNVPLAIAQMQKSETGRAAFDAMLGGPLLRVLAGERPKDFSDKAKQEKEAAQAESDKKAGKTGFMDNVKKGMDLALQSMRKATGSSASTMGIAAASRQAQLAALNANPIDLEILKVQREGVQLMEQQVAETKEMRKQLRPPTQ